MTPETPAPSTLADWLRTAPPAPDARPAVVLPRTAAQDSVIRMACALWATALRAPLPPGQRAWLLAWVQEVSPTVPLTHDEREAIYAPLLAWVREAHPAIVGIVARQFEG